MAISLYFHIQVTCDLLFWKQHHICCYSRRY